MVSASFQNHDLDSLWLITKIMVGYGPVACMCCVIFLGLKLKWFRAQFKVQNAPKNKKSTDTVQGIGYKIKSNSEDFQRYKVVSEFATPTNHTNIQNNISDSEDANYSTELNKVTKSNQETSNTINEEKNNRILKLEDANKNSLAPIHTNNEGFLISTKNNDVSKQDSNEVWSTIHESKETSFDEYKNVTEIRTSVEKKKYVSFAKNKSLQQKAEQIESVKLTTEENVFTQEYHSQIRNPQVVNNTGMPQKDEDNWKISITNEKLKEQIDNRNDDTYYEEIHLNNNNTNKMLYNSMYSSQAASIFFDSYDEKQPPDSSPPPIPRKFLEDEDSIWMSSQTSA